MKCGNAADLPNSFTAEGELPHRSWPCMPAFDMTVPEAGTQQVFWLDVTVNDLHEADVQAALHRPWFPLQATEEVTSCR